MDAAGSLLCMLRAGSPVDILSHVCVRVCAFDISWALRFEDPFCCLKCFFRFALGVGLPMQQPRSLNRASHIPNGDLSPSSQRNCLQAKPHHSHDQKTHLLALGIVVSGVPLLCLLRRGRNLPGRLSESLARGLRRHYGSSVVLRGLGGEGKEDTW